MRISDWSSDVCSSDLLELPLGTRWSTTWAQIKSDWFRGWRPAGRFIGGTVSGWFPDDDRIKPPPWVPALRSEEHTSELQSLMRISYAVFCLKKKKAIELPSNIDAELDNTNDSTS